MNCGAQSELYASSLGKSPVNLNAENHEGHVAICDCANHTCRTSVSRNEADSLAQIVGKFELMLALVTGNLCPSTEFVI
jgi:hypothetical protein